jgi:hypothetical protein
LSARWITAFSGLLLVLGVGCCLVTWAPWWHDTDRWWPAAFGIVAYVFLTIGAWGFRHDWRGALPIAVVLVLAVAPGCWVLWEVRQGDSEGLEVLLAIVLGIFQLLLANVALMWAIIWTSNKEAGTASRNQSTS